MLLFYLLIITLPLTNHRLLNLGAGGFTVAKLIGALCLPVVVFTFAEKRQTSGFAQNGVLWCFVYFTVAMISYVLSFLYMVGFTWDLMAMNNILSILLLLVFALVMVNSVSRLHWILIATVTSGALASVYVVREWLENRSFAGYRPGSISGDANYYGICAAGCLPLIFALHQARPPRWEKLYLTGCFVVTVFGFGMAASRGALVGVVAGFVLILSRSGQRFRKLLKYGVLVVPLLALAPNSPVGRLVRPTADDDKAADARRVAWKSGLRMFAENPITGVGVGQFRYRMLRYEYEYDRGEIEKVHTVAHNTYLEIAAEQGLVGFLPFICVLIAAYVTLGRQARETARVGALFLHQACLGLQASVVAVWISAFFVSAWWFRFTWWPVFLAFCVQPIAMTVVKRAKKAARSSAAMESAAVVPAKGRLDDGNYGWAQ
jgi:O-antigen ligase